MDQTKTPSGPPVAALDKSRAGKLKRVRAFTPPDWIRGLLRNRKATIGIVILLFLFSLLFSPTSLRLHAAQRVSSVPAVLHRARNGFSARPGRDRIFTPRLFTVHAARWSSVS